jgi:WD40 repeat protein
VLRDDVQLQVWQTSRWQELSHLRKTGESAVGFSPDGRYLVSTAIRARRGSATTWEVSSGRAVATFEQQDQVLDVQISPDGRLLLSRDVSSAASLHDLMTGADVKLVERFSGPGAFSVDGEYLAIARQDYRANAWKLQVWNLRRREQVGEFGLDPRPIGLTFSPDSQYLAAGAGDRLRIWDIAARQEVMGITGSGNVSTVKFSPDGRHLMGKQGGGARIWLWRPEDLMTAACARLTRNLTAEEWQRLLPDEPPQPTCSGLSPLQPERAKTFVQARALGAKQPRGARDVPVRLIERLPDAVALRGIAHFLQARRRAR